MNTNKLTLALMLALICGSASAEVTPFLGAAQQFAVLGAQTVTNTDATTLHGDLGVAPGSAITGTDGITFASGGMMHQTDAAATQAQLDGYAAYTRLQALTGGIDLSGQDLGSVGRLSSGIYRFSTSAALTGAMTLDFANDPGGVIIFQIGSTLTTASNSVVNVLNGTSSNGIYFQVGSSATLGEGSAFAGNILAQQSVSFGSASSIGCGRALALAASVTMIGNSISNDCGAYAPTGLAGDYGSSGYSGFGTAPLPSAALPSGEVPEPATLALFMLGLFGTALLQARRGPVPTAACTATLRRAACGR
jgi:type VI secretion system secreted protein VgrG